MLSFFRKARKVMIKKGDLLKYIYYALGEVLIIIIGILLAVQINNYYKRNNTKIEEKKILSNLEIEFIGNIKELKNRIYNLKLAREKGDSILYFINNPEDINKEDLKRYIGWRGLGNNGRISQKKGITQSIISSGNLNLIADDTLRMLISSWPDWVKIINKNDYHHVDNLFHEYNPFLYDHFPFRNEYWVWLDSIDQDYLGRSQHNFNLHGLLANKKFENIVVARNDILFDHLAACNRTLEKAEEIKEKIEMNLAPN